jgi:hypothetical protein
MSGQLLAREVALKPGQTALIVNGRVRPSLYASGKCLQRVIGNRPSDR